MSNAENNKRIAKNTALLYVRMLLMMAVQLYTSRVVLNALGVTDFGIYNVVAGFVTMFAFLNSSMSAATQRYLNYEQECKDGVRLYEVFCTSVNLHLLISLLVFLLAETVGLWFVNTQMNIPVGRAEAALWVYHMSILMMVVMIASVPYTAVIIAHERMSAFAYVSILEVLLKLGIVFLLMVVPLDKLTLYAVLMFVVQLLVGVAYFWYARHYFPEARYRCYWNFSLLKEMSGFAGWNLFGNIAAVAFTQGVNVLLNMFFGPVVNAARGIAVQVQNAIRSFSTNFQTALNPQITKSYASGDLQYMYKLVFASTKYSFYLLFFLSLPVILESEQVLRWWLGTVPAHANTFLRLILVISMVDALANPLIQGAMATGHIRRYQSVLGTLLLLILPFSYIALKIGYAPESVFVIHLIMVVVTHCVRLCMMRGLICLSLRDYVLKSVFPILVVACSSVIFPLCIRILLNESFLRFCWVCLACIISVGLAVFCFGLNDSERHLSMQIVRKVCKQKLL